jgi:hypothetical protein
LKAEILAFLPDFVGRQEALQLFQHEIWSNFASLLPNKSLRDRNALAGYFEEYVRVLMGYQYRTLWFVTKAYKNTDFDEILCAERYRLLKHLEQIFIGFQEDLPIILQEQKKVRLSLKRAIYTLDFLNLKINIGYTPDEDTDSDYKIQRYKTFLEEMWLQNNTWFLHHAPCLQNIFAKDLQEELASFQFEQDIIQKNALVQKPVSYHDLQTYVQHYKATNKIKHSSQAKLTLQMQSGLFSMQISTHRYWWRLITFMCLGSFFPILALKDFLGADIFAMLASILFIGGLTSVGLSDISRKIYAED